MPSNKKSNKIKKDDTPKIINNGKRMEYQYSFETKVSKVIEFEAVIKKDSRGCMVKSVKDSNLKDKIYIGSIVLGINGDRCRDHLLKTIKKKMDKAVVPTKIRFVINDDIKILKQSSTESSNNDDDTEQKMEEFMKKFDGMNEIHYAKIEHKNNNFKEAIELYDVGIYKLRQHFLTLKLPKPQRIMCRSQVNIYEKTLTDLIDQNPQYSHLAANREQQKNSNDDNNSSKLSVNKKRRTKRKNNTMMPINRNNIPKQRKKNNSLMVANNLDSGNKKLKLRNKSKSNQNDNRKNKKSKKNSKDKVGNDFYDDVDYKKGDNNGNNNDNNSGNDSNDDSKDNNNKKKSKLSKQDQEFRTRIMQDIITESPNVSFREVQGLVQVKLALFESIIMPSMHPEIFTGIRAPPTGLLLFGPPGNGKTMIAKCVASQCNSTFFSISASSITSKYVGDAERIMRTLFGLARERSPSIIFIDEIDSLLRQRGGKNEAESSRRVKTEFLVQFDGVKKGSEAGARILVIGATNLPSELDDAVLRRFQKRILVPLPDKDTRYGLIKAQLLKLNDYNITKEQIMKIVKLTQGYSCSDIAGLVKEASMGPVREMFFNTTLDFNKKQDLTSKIDAVKFKHFNQALQTIKPSLHGDAVTKYDEWNTHHGSRMNLSVKVLPTFMQAIDPDELYADNNNNNDNNNDNNETDGDVSETFDGDDDE